IDGGLLAGDEVQPSFPGFHPGKLDGNLISTALHGGEEIETDFVGDGRVFTRGSGMNRSHFCLWHDCSGGVAYDALDVSRAGLRQADAGGEKKERSYSAHRTPLARIREQS